MNAHQLSRRPLDDPAGSGGPDQLVGRLDQRAQLQFAARQLALGPPPLGDVVAHPEDAAHGAAVGEQRLEAPLHHVDGAGRRHRHLELGLEGRRQQVLHHVGEAPAEVVRDQGVHRLEGPALHAVPEHTERAAQGGRDVVERAVRGELHDELAGDLQQQVEDRAAPGLVRVLPAGSPVQHEQRPGGERLLGLVPDAGGEHRAGHDAHPHRLPVRGQQVVLERADVRFVPAARPLRPARHEVVPVGAEVLVARRPEEGRGTGGWRRAARRRP